ncbi:MAG TPA: hypothetical protein VKB34_14935 [Povalibacter sp.]|nr:hypothetical protein [Povalibacter sp.]
MKTILPLLLGLGITATTHADNWCRHEADRTAAVDAAGVKKIVIGAGAGDLEVRGEAGLTRMQAKGRACASGEDLLQEIQLESRREGDTIYLKTVLPDTHGGILIPSHTLLDLRVAVPVAVAIELDDSSGDLKLEHVQSAVVNDSSGDIEIGDISGNLQVADSSGDIDVQRVGGNLSISDSSGDITLTGVQGSVEIPVDSSGDIRVTQAGSVLVHHDSSGGIVLRHVKGDVRVDSDSSGDIDVEDVGGNFTVGSDGSGDIHHTRVAGVVQLPPR